VLTLLGGTGQVAQSQRFDPYGQRTSGSNALQPYGFAGMEQDESGLYYARNRYYAPGIGRFISEDPIGFDGGVNFYAYCGGDPVNFTDPMGLSIESVLGAAHGAADFLTGGAFSDPSLLIPGMRGYKMASSIFDLGRYAYRCGIGKAAKVVWDGFVTENAFWDAEDDYEGARRMFNFGMNVTLAAEGGVAGGKSLAGKLKAPNCFPAGTLIQLTDSSVKPIEQITDKDLVWARDDSTGETKACRINRTFHKSTDELVVLSFGELGDTSGKIVETIRCTVEHPFYVDGKGWVGAKDLGIGTEIVTRAGPCLIVRKVEREKHPSGVGIYNFEVEGLHSYFVGKTNGGVWVHNQSWKSRPRFGHTFDTHGQGSKNTTSLLGRAASTNEPQGQ
jgi:RHS repeat-associated protein